MDNNSVKNKVEERLNQIWEKLDSLDPKAEEYKTLMEEADSLINRYNELYSTETEEKAKDSRVKSDKAKLLSDVVLGTMSVGSYILALLWTYKFEESGTIRTKCFPGTKLPSIIRTK